MNTQTIYKDTQMKQTQQIYSDRKSPDSLRPTYAKIHRHKKRIYRQAQRYKLTEKIQTDWHKGTEKHRHTDRYIDTDTENIKTDRQPDTQTQKTHNQTDR